MNVKPAEKVKKVTIVPVPEMSWRLAGPLSFGIGDGIEAKSVEGLVNQTSFDVWGDYLSQREREELGSIRYALTHSFFGDPVSGKEDNDSQELLHRAFICLNVIKPVRSHFRAVHVKLYQSGSADVFSLTHPYERLLNLPDCEILNQLDLEDLELLKRLLPKFEKVSRHGPENLQRGIRLYYEGRSHVFDPRTQLILWAAGIESVISGDGIPLSAETIHDRISDLIPLDADIYQDMPEKDIYVVPRLEIRKVLGDVFSLRNLLVHGSRVPASWENRETRESISGERIPYAEMLREAASFVLRKLIVSAIERPLLDARRA